MGRFHMTDIIPLIGIPYPPPGQTSYYISCPCCDSDPQKRHLNINLKKDVFRCPRCGLSGGVFDLYAYCTGTPRDKVQETLITRLGSPRRDKCGENDSAGFSDVQECPLTDIDSRHATYEAMLSRLTLASDHRANLVSRGLSEEKIITLGYKTTPIVGMKTLAKQLLAEGFYLSGVPGFYRKDRQWTFIHESRGILIPVRDLDGRIQGLQIRRDNATRRKFRWISSVGKDDGCKAEAWIHIAGKPCEKIILTEGPMKADIVHELTSQTVLAVAGVSALSQLDSVLVQLREKGVRKIMTAFDMDFLTNPHVENGYNNLKRHLTDNGFQYGTYLWDPQYKGLDDYVWQYCLHRQIP